jgi:hypothetical protein
MKEDKKKGRKDNQIEGSKLKMGSTRVIYQVGRKEKQASKQREPKYITFQYSLPVPSLGSRSGGSACLSLSSEPQPVDPFPFDLTAESVGRAVRGFESHHHGIL